MPTSPLASRSVPETVYDPTANAPVVVMTPALLTARPVLDTVVTKVTAPVLLTTVMRPGANALEAFGVVEPVVGDVWVMAFETVSVYVQVPVSPFVSRSVPEILYTPKARLPVVEIWLPLSVSPTGLLVTVKVTGPVLLTTVMGTGGRAADDAGVVAPEVGDVWVMVVPPPGPPPPEAPATV